MAIPRIIPVLLLKNRGLVKSVRFKDYQYIGDPINAVKIFNEKGVDELIFLDIEASKNNTEPDYDYIEKIASECFMPLAYGGGIKNIKQIRELTKRGVEKVIINSEAIHNPEFIREASETFGRSTIIVALDVKQNIWKKRLIYNHLTNKTVKLNPTDFALKAQEMGAGELFVNDVDRDGTYSGYALDEIANIVEMVDIPVIACGGARSPQDLFDVIKNSKASAAAAGSIFVFHGKHKAVLITNPGREIFDQLINE